MKTIPHVCHLYWDRSPMAHLQVFTVESFHRLNPDWRIIVYLTKQSAAELGKNTYVPDYTGPDYFSRIEKLPYIEFKEIDITELGIPLDAHSCQGSDVFRMKILYDHGGVYSDFDVLWLRPMSEMVNIECLGDPSDFEATASMYQLTKGFHNVSNLVAEKGSEYILSIYEAQQRVKPPYQHQSFGSSLVNNLYPDWYSIISRFPRVLALHYNTFYPFSTFYMEQLFCMTDLSPIDHKNVICVHWFNGNRFAKEYINRDAFTPCGMTSLLRREGYI
jgi:hypothetical protein